MTRTALSTRLKSIEEDVGFEPKPLNAKRVAPFPPEEFSQPTWYAPDPVQIISEINRTQANSKL
jgi:hypothetical protein